MINGVPYGYFRGKWGIRQGDPTCLYVFVIVMELFAQIMDKSVSDEKFKLYYRCEKPVITHLSFVHDLIDFTS